MASRTCIAMLCSQAALKIAFSNYLEQEARRIESFPPKKPVVEELGGG